MVRRSAVTERIPYQPVKPIFTFIPPLGLTPNDSRTC